MDLKRKRGRPKGSKSQAKVPETKKSKADEGTLAKNQVRSSGEMSLRPNKRVRVSWFKKLQDLSDDDDLDQVCDPDEGGAAIDDDEFVEELEREAEAAAGLFDGDPTEDYDPKAHTNDEEDDDDVLEDDVEVGGMNKGSSPSKAPIGMTYNETKDLICAGCCEQLRKGPRWSGATHNLFTGTTAGGKSLYQLFVSVTRADVDQTNTSANLCSKCYSELNAIERHYSSFRRAADDFTAKFHSGQERLDCDMAMDDGFYNDDQMNATAKSVMNNLELESAVVKVVDPDLDNFSALAGVNKDFSCTVNKVYLARFEIYTDISSFTTENSEEKEDQKKHGVVVASAGDDKEAFVTLNIDYETGQVEKVEPSDPYDAANVASNKRVASEAQKILEEGSPLVYLTTSEFNTLKSKGLMSAARARTASLKALTFNVPEFFSKLCPKVFLGNETVPVLASQAVAREYAREVPSASGGGPFVCTDSGSAFKTFHQMFNHLQSMNPNGEVEEDAKEQLDEQKFKPSKKRQKLDAELDTDDKTKLFGASLVHKAVKGEVADVPDALDTDFEVATLEKPFQCRTCGKCFMNYVNLSNHIDHYHGFSRECNFQSCRYVAGSVPDFCQHYVRHMDPGYVLPEEFKVRFSTLFACPLCPVQIKGMWKFFSHAHTHDREPRFKCPVCPKKTGKVQNFKDHIKRHLVALGQGGNAESNAASSVKTPQFLSAPTRHRQCPFCRNEMLSTELSQHITESHSNEVVYACDQCDAKFAKESKLITHREKHLPKNQWKFGCILCDLVFPTQPRLKLHNVNSHASLGLQCCDCGSSLANRTELREHMRVCHGVEAPIYLCNACGRREYSLQTIFMHYRMEHHTNDFKCFGCQQCFDNESSLHAHYVESHPDLVGNLGSAFATASGETSAAGGESCLHCDQIFEKSAMLLRHVRFAHLLETIEIDPSLEEHKELLKRTDLISEVSQPDNQQVVRMHIVP